MDCSKCSSYVPKHLRHCPACESEIGFPNVRAAAESQNIQALDKRVDDAKISARARKCGKILEDFNAVTMSSYAILCRPLSIVCRIMKSDRGLLNTYYQQIEGGELLPEEDKWDASRESVDSKLFPHYHKHIHHAFLALGKEIIEHYGKCGLLLKEAAIEDRASVFEENSILFCERHGIAGTKEVPDGYRAIWKNRNNLAVAKLHPKLDDTKTNSDFPEILLSKTSDNDAADFIEVHIYGTIHRKTVERVLAKSPTEKADKVILDSLKDLLAKEGIPLEIVK